MPLITYSRQDDANPNDNVMNALKPAVVDKSRCLMMMINVTMELITSAIPIHFLPDALILDTTVKEAHLYLTTILSI